MNLKQLYRFIYVMLPVAFTLMLQGCYYDKEEELYPNNNEFCDTTGVTYAGTIVPILTDNCITCHSGSAPSGNITLDNYSGVRTQALSGALYGSIAHDPQYSPMPQGGNKLSNCAINKVKIWVLAGAPDN